MNRKLPIAIAVTIVFLVQSATIVWMVWDRMQILTKGEIVKLDVKPVDPRDIFRGDYVILNYEMAELIPDLLGSTEHFSAHDHVYVEIEEQRSGTWKAVSIHTVKPEPRVGRVVIAGRVQSAYEMSSGGDAASGCRNDTCQRLHIKYGIESYFVPEGQGREIETARNESKVVILAAVDASGASAIKGLIIDGELRYEEPLF